MTPNKKSLLFLPALALCLLAQEPAFAFVSDWAETDGARMRLSIDPQAVENGVYRGSLEIDLDEGWKTYWQEPGSAGIPPLIAFDGDGLRLKKTGFPPPVRIQDGDVSWAGYSQSTALALTLEMPDRTATAFSANVFIGVCEKICVPFQATFAGTLQPSGAGAEAGKIAQAAFDALPQEPQKDFTVRSVEIEGDRIVASVALPAFRPAGTKPELFAVPPGGYVFGTPKLMPSPDSEARFAIPVLKRPDRASGDAFIPLSLTVTLGNRAIALEAEAR